MVERDNKLVLNASACLKGFGCLLGFVKVNAWHKNTNLTLAVLVTHAFRYSIEVDKALLTA